jgi:DNA ligase (NAD+)
MPDRVKELADIIQEARNAYYNGQAIMPDASYDKLYDELAKLDPEHPAITGIGAEPVSEWKKYKHEVNLGSLNKSNTQEEFINWADKYCVDEQFFVCPKLDGLSISLVYKKGKLIVAATRGSGVEGENITANVIKMGGIPKKLNANITVTIRGEIVLSKANHKKHFPDYSNARNAASGISRRYDGEGCQYLNVIVYQIRTDDTALHTLDHQFKLLNQLGFTTPDYSLFDNAKDVYEYFVRFQNEIRNTIDVDLDGLVVSVNDIDKFESHGYSSNRPRAAIAMKFENECAETVIRDIQMNCGNSGRITPVAIFDEVEIAGAKITNASCYNMAFLETMGIDIGAKVMVERCNEVIPAVAEVIENTGTIFKAPKHCPVCNGDLVMNGENLQCTNVDGCKSQISGGIKNWVSGLNILELGDTLIDRLVEAGLVATPADLYKLTLDDLAGLERMGKKSAENVYKSLWSITEIPLDVFLGSLSIPLVARSSVKFVMNAGLDTLDKILNASEIELQCVKGLGPVKIKSFYDGLKKNADVIEQLLESGIKVKTMSNGGKLNGKSFCITGATNIKRDDLKIMIEEAGGVFAKSVSKTTNFLVMADPSSNSVKAVKARSNGTAVISEDDLLNMIE